MNTNQPTLESFCRGAATLVGLESALSGNPVDPEWVKKIALWKTGLFRIVVMGEIKKGKSSFINALLGYKDLVPVNSDVATSTIFKICYGPEVGYKVFFLQDSAKKPIAIQTSELTAYGTEDGNPGNQKQVDFIQVFCPSPLLKAGLVIVDTPGLGGLFKQHKRITYQYVPKADAVFLVTDSVESPIGQAELDLLADLKKVTKHIFFVQTKSRLVDADAREARKENNLRILSEQAGFDKIKIRYFVVDSATKIAADEEKNLKKLDRSGFDDVARFVNGYIRPNVHRLLMARAFAEIRPKIEAVSGELEAKSAILKTRTEEERAALTRKLEKQKARFEEWERHGKNEIKEKIETGLSDIRKKALDKLDRFDPTGGGLILEIEETLNKLESVQELQKTIDSLQDSLPGSLSEELFGICDTAQRQTGCLLREIAETASVETRELDLATNRAVDFGVSQIHQTLVVDTKFNKARTTMFSGMAGAGIGSGLGGVLGGVIGFCCGGIGAIPGAQIGSALGGLIGQPFGYYLGHQDQKVRQLDQARKMALGLVSKWLASCYKGMNRSFGETFDRIRRHVLHEFEAATQKLREEPTAHMAEIKAMGQRSNEEIAAKSAELQKRQEAFKRALVEMRGETVVAAKGA
ncbi:MAG: dynamin family protein [Kiritimatiellae bacterium]|nr:dynamin family protein [Kiritimatiellia bacterium]